MTIQERLTHLLKLHTPAELATLGTALTAVGSALLSAPKHEPTPSELFKVAPSISLADHRAEPDAAMAGRVAAAFGDD